MIPVFQIIIICIYFVQTRAVRSLYFYVLILIDLAFCLRVGMEMDVIPVIHKWFSSLWYLHMIHHMPTNLTVGIHKMRRKITSLLFPLYCSSLSLALSLLNLGAAT